MGLWCADCRVVSLGRGQQSHARRAVTQTMVSGGWVVLQNGHLCTEYLTEALTQITSTDKLHSQFRLWITAAPSDQFPVNVLQVC